MDIKEIEKWVESAEGAKWLDGKKSGLIKKNEELIKELKTASGGMSELTQRVTDMEKQLLDKQAELKRSLIDIPLENTLREYGCFEILIPQICRELSEVYDLHIKDSLPMGKLKNDNESIELPMGDIVDSFLKTETGRQYVNPARIKTEIVSTCLDVKGGNKPTNSLGNKTGQELAKMSDQEFQDAIQQSMR